MGLFIVIILLFYLVLVVGMFFLICAGVIGLWKMFTKAGQEGWKALIPVYNYYVLCNIVGLNPYWILILAICFLLQAVPVIGGVLFTAATIYFGVILSISTARSYGKEDAFAIGLFLLPPIFWLIIGLGNNKYEGAKSVKDPVFDWLMELLNKNSDTNNVNTNTTNNSKVSEAEVINESDVKYCGQCGSKLDSSDKFCPNCGNKIN